MADVEKLKEIACNAIDAAAKELNSVSEELWNHPELGFEEKHAHNVLSTFLESSGFNVQRNYILETGFRGRFGTEGSGPHVSVLSEYDALPEIGHACGHNLIAEVGVGAGLGIKAAIDAAKKEGKDIGQLTVLGTPAEEGGGGKVDLIKEKVFKNIDISMMCHPFPYTFATVDALLAIQQYEYVSVIGCPAEECGGGGKIDLLCNKAFDSLDIAMMCHPYPFDWADPIKFALEILKITYIGKASHAAGFPWDGVNALDAAVMAYTSISVLRQQMKPDWRIHGVITNGGAKPNIIPEKSEMEYYVRAPRMADLEVLKAKAIKCFEAAAVATGCKVELEWHPKPYYNVITNKTLANLFEVNGTSLGVEFCRDEAKIATASGSTDMGNVSHVVPSIHPMYYIGSEAVNHTRDFTTASGSPKAQSYTIKQAKALAMTAIDVMCSPDLMAQVKQGFQQDLLSQKA